jgi:hypothetical protein
MRDYHVRWDVSVPAENAEQAARKALALQRDPASPQRICVLDDVGDGRQRWRPFDLTDNYEGSSEEVQA